MDGTHSRVQKTVFPVSTGGPVRAPGWRKDVFCGGCSKFLREQNAGDHAGYRLGMACKGCHVFGRILEEFITIWIKTTNQKLLERRASYRQIYRLPVKQCRMDVTYRYVPNQYFQFPPAHVLEDPAGGKTCRKTCFQGCDPENTGDDQTCRGSCRIPSRNDMPRSDGDTPARAQWVPSMVNMGHFPPERLQEHLSDAPQRRGYTRSLPMGPIDGTHGCPQKTVFVLPIRASVRAHVKVERRVLRGATQKTQEIIKECRKSCRIPSRNGMPSRSFSEHFG
eukprot:gene19147-biopygen2477